jgi:hypothetical protein
MPSKLLLKPSAGFFFSVVLTFGALADESNSAEAQATRNNEQGRRIDRITSGSQFKDIPPFQLQGPPGPPPDAPGVNAPATKAQSQGSDLVNKPHLLAPIRPIFDLDR